MSASATKEGPAFISPGDALEVDECIGVQLTVYHTPPGQPATGGDVVAQLQITALRGLAGREAFSVGMSAWDVPGAAEEDEPTWAATAVSRTLEGAQHAMRLWILENHAEKPWAQEALDLVVDDLPRALQRHADRKHALGVALTLIAEDAAEPAAPHADTARDIN